MSAVGVGYASVQDIRGTFARLLVEAEPYGLGSAATLEIVGASFVADDDTIFGQVNHAYVAREVAWYDSRSLNVNEIPGKVPEVWRVVSSKEGGGGWINSNYGFLLYDEDNHSQFDHVVDELHRDISSRRAIAIYTRPSMHDEWDNEGMSDFICTNAVQYLVRDWKLNVVVQMRSNDAIFGYRNDFAWQRIVQLRLLDQLQDRYPGLELGPIIWQAGSLHVYPRHFDLVRKFRETGEYRVAVG